MPLTPSLRDLPSIGALLDDGSVRERFRGYSRKMLAEAMRLVVARWRQVIRQGHSPKGGISREAFLQEVDQLLAELARPGLRPVINATGVILNTNLGRTPLTDTVIKHLSRVSCGYCNLEIELGAGTRRLRDLHVVRLLVRLTGSPAALVVNNNAAAVLLILNTLAQGRQVIVSRGELIEIGGSFRLPEVMSCSGAQLVEVGTTNRTYLEDYRKAITAETAMLFRSHTSNYQVVGFTHRPSLEELVRLGKRRRLVTVEDLGSGLLDPLDSDDLAGEPTVREALRSGVDLVCFSGDKLLGGPQSGIVLGRQRLISLLRSNPLSRALRVDKITLAALEAVLRLYLYADHPQQALPHIRMILLPLATVRGRARRLLRQLQPFMAGRIEAQLLDGHSTVGGGSYPGASIPTCLVGLRAPGMGPSQLARSLRSGQPTVVGRVAGDRLVLDLRTVDTRELPGLRQALIRLCQSLEHS